MTKEHKQEYLALIIRQKTAALERNKQRSHRYIATRQNEEELLSLSNQPICKPKKLKTEEAVPMTDEDFLIAELNVDSQRYYAFVETLFVIDQNYFPRLSEISYDDYIRTIVDTTNIVFQSQNDLDIKIEIIISNIVYLNIVQPKSQEPYAYESILRQSVSDYERYDSIVLLWYQPWEGPHGAQGYAILKGACHPSYKIMYVLPYQNAAFYLAHEFGHQLGLNHQVDTPCFTTSYMSVMTKSHTASYEQARWTKCENNWINENICLFECLFNKPDNYQPIKNKYSTLPGKRMSNDQQAKMIEPNSRSLGEVSSFTFMPSNLASRCLYLRYYIGGSNGEYKYAYSPMLPGSECGENSICYLDKCVSKNDINPSLFNNDFDTEILYLNTHCSSSNNPKELSASNYDSRHNIECIDWENDFLCEPSQSCPKPDDSSTLDLYIKHVCCAKCSSKVNSIITLFNQARVYRTSPMFVLIILTSLSFFTYKLTKIL
ncbi:unnamed protein product [Rotaria sp. Silwood1]|nr:unnamed protein product [Rotaria sp. Silwood1]